MSFHSRNIKISWGSSDMELNFVFNEVKDEEVKSSENYEKLVEKINQ